MTERSHSPFVLATRLVGSISGQLSAFDTDDITQAQRLELGLLKRLLADARLDARDYELSETRAEQIENAEQARVRLDELRLLILHTSEYNVFSAIEVSQTTAQVDEIIGLLQ